MDAERRARVEALFLRIADLEPARREAAISDACADDPELERELRSLLVADAASDETLRPFHSRAWLHRNEPVEGAVVGPYRLTGRIGEGGMGVVFRAQRTDGLFEREVAVKLVRAERLTEEAIRRFDLERRALAALDHPNIARLYDGGTMPDGTPYLVMELVAGEPIDRFCDLRRLSVDERLRLFAIVCRAAHFAHQSLVVHRDLKPSNLLIDADGLPRLLDFGIARLLDGAAPPDATETAERALTPDYAAPEQLLGGPVTTAIDVYALGVVLYELLTGTKPFVLPRGSGLVEWQRAVLEDEPERLSARVSRAARDPTGGGPSSTDVAAHRATTPSGLRRRLEGDLDRIALAALRKEPERRYASAQALAEDIERHLAGRPIAAREDSLAYRATRFVRRNRIAIATALAVLIAGTSALVVSLRSERRARHEALHARIEAESFGGIAEFVMDTFLTSGFSVDDARVSAALEQIRLHAARVRSEHADEHHLRANLLDALGRVCMRLDLFEESEELLNEALAIRREAFGERSLEYALSLRSLGLLAYRRGRLEQASGRFAEALELHRTCPPGTHTDVAAVANDLAVARRALGDLDAAEALHRQALALRRAGGPGSLSVAETLNNLSGVHLDRGEHEEARELLTEALGIRRDVLSPHHPLTLQALSNLSLPTWHLGRRAEAIELLEEAAAGLRRLSAAGEEGLPRVLSSLAGMRIVLGRLDEAEGNLSEALALDRERLGDDHPLLAGPTAKLAELQHRRGLDDAARASWLEAIRLRRALGSARGMSDALFGYGRFLSETDALRDARDAFREAVELLRAEPGTEPLALGRAELALGACLVRLELAAEATPHLRDAAELLRPYPIAEQDLERAQGLLARLATEDAR